MTPRAKTQEFIRYLSLALLGTEEDKKDAEAYLLQLQMEEGRKQAQDDLWKIAQEVTTPTHFTD